MIVAGMVAGCGGGEDGAGAYAGTKTYFLARTGKTAVYSAGDDGAVLSGAGWPSPRLVDVGDGAVTWQHALDFVSGINAGTQPGCGAGHIDWRLPNRNELLSLGHAGRADIGVWLGGAGFSNVQGSTTASTDHYWTSTTAAPDTESAWTMDAFKGLSPIAQDAFFPHTEPTAFSTDLPPK